MSPIIYLSILGGILLGGPSPLSDKPDACTLLSGDEIAAIQGEPVIAMKGSVPERSAHDVSQCFYTMSTFSKSVSLEVTRRGPAGRSGSGPREQWRRFFHPSPAEGDAGPEKAEESEAAVPIAGLGDEAFWTGDGFVGALYVLKGESYLRISIGGGKDSSTRLERSKRLAAVALKRLS